MIGQRELTDKDYNDNEKAIGDLFKFFGRVCRRYALASNEQGNIPTNKYAIVREILSDALSKLNGYYGDMMDKDDEEWKEMEQKIKDIINDKLYTVK